MNKKFKYTSLVAAGAVTLGLVGGTLAWFTSQDKVENHFSTIGNNQNGANGSGIKINEIWNEDEAQNITPGTEVNKDVRVQNTSAYNQFIRVKFEIKILDKAGNDITNNTVGEGSEMKKLSEFIELNLASEYEQIWSKQVVDNQEYYYYLDIVGPTQVTNYLLDSVTLSSEAGAEFKDVNFDVIVIADGIQATNGAYATWAPADLHDEYAQWDTTKITTSAQ